MITLWHGLQKGPILDSFKQIVQEYNVEHPAPSQIALVDFNDYGQPAREALAKPDTDQPNLVLAPEFQTTLMNKALSEKKVIPICKLLKKNDLTDIADIVKKTFGDIKGNLACLPMNPSCGVIFTNQDMLKASGRDPDWVPSSMEELEEVCLELKNSVGPALGLLPILLKFRQHNKTLH